MNHSTQNPEAAIMHAVSNIVLCLVFVSVYVYIPFSCAAIHIFLLSQYVQRLNSQISPGLEEEALDVWAHSSAIRMQVRTRFGPASKVKPCFPACCCRLVFANSPTSKR